jgi:hypothetical protein
MLVSNRSRPSEMNPMKKLLLAAVTMLMSATAVHAQPAPCTEPKQLPAAGVADRYCDNGRMGFAATESAAISQLKNMPRARAISFARHEAELHARAALAKFLSKGNLSFAEHYEEQTNPAESQSWQALYKATTDHTIRDTLVAGIAVIAVDTQEGAVYVTVASSPDLSRFVDSINNGFSK